MPLEASIRHRSAPTAPRSFCQLADGRALPGEDNRAAPPPSAAAERARKAVASVEPAAERVSAWNAGSRGRLWNRRCVCTTWPDVHFPKTYLDLLRLRFPPYVKIILDNRFPRSQVTTNIGRAPAFYYGPFRSRATAEEFETSFCDLFQMRRCRRIWSRRPQHPGCIYGEMGMCLRPCQQVVACEEYRREVDRVLQFLADGRPIAGRVRGVGARAAEPGDELRRSRAPAQAAGEDRGRAAIERRVGHRYRPPERSRGHGVDRGGRGGVVAGLSGMLAAAAPLFHHRFQCVARSPIEGSIGGAGVETSLQARERQEHLALLARWYYSSWREGEWLAFESSRMCRFAGLCGWFTRREKVGQKQVKRQKAVGS